MTRRAAEAGPDCTTFTMTAPGRLKATAWIDASGPVLRIDSVMPHPVPGDMPGLTRFGDIGRAL